MANITPLQDRVLIKKEEKKSSQEETVKGGIVLPSEEEPIKYGEVISISEELKDCPLKEGHKVLYSEHAGKNVKIDDEEYILIPYKEISGIIEF